MGWHKFGKRVEIDGVLTRVQFWGTMNDEDFEKYTIPFGLPPGWWAWHEGSCDEDLLRKVPVLVIDYPAHPFLGSHYASWEEDIKKFIEQKEREVAQNSEKLDNVIVR